MAQRIKPTDVTAAYRAAVVSARAAGVDTEDWTLKLDGSRFSVVTRDHEGGGHHIAPGWGVYMGGYFASSYREAYDTLHAMARAWDMTPRYDENTVGKYPCWHVDADNGMTYGVAANSKHDAMAMVNRRLRTEWAEDPDNADGYRATKAVKVAEWSTAYGTVLCYGATL